MEDIRGLLNLVDGGTQTCAEVKERTELHLADVRAKIADLKGIEKILSATAAQCSGNDVLEALAEIAGCFAFWAWLRLDRSPLWLVPGIASLALFAWLLTRFDSDFAGRALGPTAASTSRHRCSGFGWRNPNCRTVGT